MTEELEQKAIKKAGMYVNNLADERHFPKETEYTVGLDEGFTDGYIAGATEATKELQEYNLMLEKQIEEMKSDVKSNIKWADQNKNGQMWQKLVKMYNQWEQKHK